MIESLIEELPFLGARTYLQGTTLFSCLFKHVPPDARFSFKVPRFIRSPRIKVMVVEQIGEGPDSWDAMLKWEKEEHGGFIYVNALPFDREPTRVPFDESKVVGLSEFSKAGVVLDKESPFEFVTTIVSLNKAYLLRNVTDLGVGQWVFTRLDLTRLPAFSKGLRIEFEVGLQGKRVTKSGIWMENVRLGDLYFAWVNKP